MGVHVHTCLVQERGHPIPHELRTGATLGGEPCAAPALANDKPLAYRPPVIVYYTLQLLPVTVYYYPLSPRLANRCRLKEIMLAAP